MVGDPGYSDLLTSQLSTRYQDEKQKELVPWDYDPPSEKMTCHRSRKKPPFFIAVFCYFLVLVQVIVFHLKAVENVRLFRQDWDERSVSCQLGVRHRASMLSTTNTGARYLRSSCWVYLEAIVYLSAGVKNGILWYFCSRDWEPLMTLALLLSAYSIWEREAITRFF